jgi:putative oxidoreductase
MTALPRTLGRLLLAWIFVQGGQDVLRNPDPRVRTASGFLDELRARVPLLPADNLMLVRANAAVMVLGGAVLALGVRPFSRLAALALCVSLIPTTLSGHAYWTHSEPAARAQQWIHFNKNLALLGGLLYLALED